MSDQPPESPHEIQPDAPLDTSLDTSQKTPQTNQPPKNPRKSSRKSSRKSQSKSQSKNQLESQPQNSEETESETPEESQSEVSEESHQEISTESDLKNQESLPPTSENLAVTPVEVSPILQSDTQSKDQPQAQSDAISETQHEELDEDDFNFFIRDLQRIIDESPPGMQAKFARTISYLKEKKNTLKSLGKLIENPERQEIYRRVLTLVDGETEIKFYDEEKFQNVLNLVKLREDSSTKKAAKHAELSQLPGGSPKGVSSDSNGMKSSLGAEKKDQEIVLRVERIPTISSVKSVDVKSAVQISGGKRSRKISFLGAGSLVFTKSLLTDILSFPELQSDSVLCLEDIDQKRLDLMLRYFKKYQEDNISVLKDITIESTTNQRKAITDSRYVISAIQAGGLDAYTIDMDIPQKYGVYQVVGDSLGPGGVFRFLRTVPIFETILNDIAEVGEQGQPNGSKPYFFNYTNPMAMNTWYANIIATDSTVGLCHGVQGTAQLLKRWIGAITPGEFSYLCAGINHMAWFLKLWYKDPFADPSLKGPWKDAYPIIWEHFKEEPEMTHEEKVRIDMMKATGFFMTESSGHLAEYLPYYLKRKDLIAKYKSEKGQGFETLEQSNYLKSNLEKLGRMESEFEHSFQLEKLNFKSTHSDEYCANIIHSLETGQLFQFNGNIMNKHGGLITNLPADCCVEVPITVDHMGLHPQGGIELPPICQGLCMSNIMVQHAAVKGALYRRRDLINHAVMLDPNTASILAPEEIKQMVDDLFKAQKKWLPAGFYSNY